MGTASVRSTGRHPAVTSGGGRSAGRRWLAGLAAALVLAVAVAWWLGWIGAATDPRVAEILALQAQARERFEQRGGGADAPVSLADATVAATSMMEIRQRTEALPAHLREQVERNGSDMFRSAFRARIDRYFSLPPEQRLAEIDRQIDEEETWRRAFEAGQAALRTLGVGGGQEQRPQEGGGTAGSNQPWASRTEEERNRWRKTMVDRTSPEERARYTEWRRARDARREQRGLPERWPR